MTVKELANIVSTNLDTTELRAALDNDGDDYDGFFCINTTPFNCDCREDPWVFIHFEHKIVVWEEKDDPKLLDFAHKTQELGMNPKIVEFEHGMGKAITWDDIPAKARIG